MKDAADVVTKRLYFRKLNDSYESEPIEDDEFSLIREAVLFLVGSSRYEILGIERACDGNNHDADGTIEITDIGCAHSEWYDFNIIYVDHPGWGIDSVNKIVATFTDIDLAKWSMYYDLWGDGECLARHVLAKDNKSGEIVLFRIKNERDYYYRRSAYYAEKTQ